MTRRGGTARPACAESIQPAEPPGFLGFSRPGTTWGGAVSKTFVGDLGIAHERLLSARRANASKWATRHARNDTARRDGYTCGRALERPARLHQIAVRVSRPGVRLRYRHSYQAETTAPPRTPSTRDLIGALNRPVDATAIAITASATRTPDRVQVTESFDLSSLDLQLEGGLWKGRAEVVARFLAADGAGPGKRSRRR
jgi:hypothetical protein